jgi:hypothetical protein
MLVVIVACEGWHGRGGLRRKKILKCRLDNYSDWVDS